MIGETKELIACARRINDNVVSIKDYGLKKRFRDTRQMKTLLDMAPLEKIEIIDQINAMR